MTDPMNPFPAAATVIGSVGSQSVIQNVGAKRIVGTDLLTLGKVPQFVYYLIDLSQICFYANDATDTWIGGFGQPIAGTLAQRDSLQPFQGQTFYIIATDVSYTYKGGAWEGGVIEANILAPTFLELLGATGLTRGRSHLVMSGGAYTLPPLDDSALGESLVGHVMQVVVQRDVIATLQQYLTEGFVNDVSKDEAVMNLTAGNLYTIVKGTLRWEVYVVDLTNFQLQLDGLEANKLDKSTTIDVAAGIVKTGVLGDNNLAFGADFATAAEAIDPANQVKVINPSHLPVAVADATRASAFNNITGLLPKSTETKFALTATGPKTSVDYPEFSAVFNPAPFVRDAALVSLTIPAGSIALPSNVLITTHRVVLLQNGTILLQAALPMLASVNEIFLGTVAEQNGVVFFDGIEDVLITTPWLASSDYNIRIDPLFIESGAIVSPAGTQGNVNMTPATLRRESINWEDSTINPHKRTITPTNPIKWFYVDRAGTILSGPIDEVDGRYLDDDSTSVGNGKFSIQVGLFSSEGDIAILKGQGTYDKLTDALAAVDNYSPVVPAALANALEFTRWVVKGDQFPGNGNYDLTVTDNFQVSQGADVSGGLQTVSAGDVSSSNTTNTLASTNLQTQVDELSARTDWELVAGTTTPAELVLVDPNTLATEAGAYTLAAVPAAGVRVRWAAMGGIEPTFTLLAGQIVSSNSKFPDDTVFLIEAADNGKIFELISDGTNLIL